MSGDSTNNGLVADHGNISLLVSRNQPKWWNSVQVTWTIVSDASFQGTQP